MTVHRLCVENQGSGSYPHCLKICSNILFLGPLLCHSSQISSLTFLLPSPRFVKIRLDRDRMASGLIWACPNTGLGARASEISGISSHNISSNGSVTGWTESVPSLLKTDPGEWVEEPPSKVPRDFGTSGTLAFFMAEISAISLPSFPSPFCFMGMSTPSTSASLTF